MIFEWLKSFLYGIVEGVTEWLPISSTGHLILLSDKLPLRISEDPAFNAEFWEMFGTVIQFGAIFAVVVLFWNKLWPFGFKKTKSEVLERIRLWLHIAVASIPAAVVGFGVDTLIKELTGKTIDGWLYNSIVVALALIIYGVLFIVIERVNRDKRPLINTVEEIDYKHAFFIGCFQSLAAIPGTSRSGSTIIGATGMGVSRTAAAEFAFFMAVPVMAGAGGFKMLGFFKYVGESGVSVPADAWITLAIGCITAFAVSMVAIRFLLGYVKRHSYSSFGVYRIILGALVLLKFCFDW